MTRTVLVVVEHDRGAVAPATFEALAAAGSLGDRVEALALGAVADAAVTRLGEFGAEHVHRVAHDLLDDYGPEAWGEAVAQVVRAIAPATVVATGTDRGNEVLAQAAARLDLPFAANCLEFRFGDEFETTRVRWGGSLLEDATMTSDVLLVTVAHHAFEPVALDEADTRPTTVSSIDVEIDPVLARSMVSGRVEREAGVTLATAPVVVGGGRGVGSPEGFGPLQELADELGGVVGCSRAVTNNGWRNHTDQVGQTGTRIAPDVYFACGISGAIQHWVGAMASKHIIAINTDREANMVTKADFAVIADLHVMVPAIPAEIRRRNHLGTGTN
jgi:electron transfer flavoprotein alpha subunit